MRTTRPGTTRRAALMMGSGAMAASVAAMLPSSSRAQSSPGVPSAAPSRIGIIGSGNIGGAIGSLWVQAGHPVLFSSRHPEELKGLVDGLGSLARAGTPQEAVAFGDVVFVAVPYGAMPGISREFGSAFGGKVLLDACNAVAGRDGEVANAANAKGIGLATAGYFPSARVVRAFNTLGVNVFKAQAHRPGAPLAVPIAGDDPNAITVASGLVRDAGFEPVPVGPLARATEFAMGSRGFGQALDAQQLRQLLSLSASRS